MTNDLPKFAVGDKVWPQDVQDALGVIKSRRYVGGPYTWIYAVEWDDGADSTIENEEMLISAEEESLRVFSPGDVVKYLGDSQEYVVLGGPFPGILDGTARRYYAVQLGTAPGRYVPLIRDDRDLELRKAVEPQVTEPLVTEPLVTEPGTDRRAWVDGVPYSLQCRYTDRDGDVWELFRDDDGHPRAMMYDVQQPLEYVVREYGPLRELPLSPGPGSGDTWMSVGT